MTSVTTIPLPLSKELQSITPSLRIRYYLPHWILPLSIFIWPLCVGLKAETKYLFTLPFQTEEYRVSHLPWLGGSLLGDLLAQKRRNYQLSRTFYETPKTFVLTCTSLSDFLVIRGFNTCLLLLPFDSNVKSIRDVHWFMYDYGESFSFHPLHRVEHHW